MRDVVGYLATACTVVLSACGAAERPELHIDADVAPYVGEFIAEAGSRGIPMHLRGFTAHVIPDEAFDHSITKAPPPDATFIGYCENHTDLKIRKSYWDSATTDERRLLIYHESGHCILGLEHVPGPDIMSEVLMPAKEFEAHRAVYVERLMERAEARELSERHGLDPDLVAAIITVESNWNPKAVGSAGELGLLQLHPKFYRDFSLAAGIAVLASSQRQCPLRGTFEWVICHNVGVAGAAHIKHPTLFPYFKKVMKAYHAERQAAHQDELLTVSR